MALKLPSISIERLESLLAYDPVDGALTWVNPQSNRLKPGQLAGTLRRDGVVVAIDSVRYPALYLCWALYHRRWPTQPLGLRNASRTWIDENYGHLSPTERLGIRLRNVEDLRIENIVPYEETLSQAPDAVARRAARVSGERYDRAIVRNATARGSRYDNVRWSEHFRRWDVYHAEPARRDTAHLHVVIASFEHLADAEACAEGHAQALRVLADHPPRTPPFPAWDATAGPTGHNLDHILRVVAYDPDTGIFANRTTMLRADQPQPLKRKGRYVQVEGRRYQAHMLAWFIVNGVWPARRGLVWLDGNPHNNAIANLVPRAAVVDEEWIPLADVRFEPPAPDVEISKNVLGSEMVRIYEYKPGTGDIVYRFGTPSERGKPVLPVPHNEGQPLYVSCQNRHWPAHMLAVFLHSGRWPSRGGIRWINGRRDDNRLDNLLVRKADYA